MTQIMKQQTSLAFILTTALSTGFAGAQTVNPAPPVKPEPPAAATRIDESMLRAGAAVTLANKALVDMDAAALASEMALVAGAKVSLMADHAQLASKMAAARDGLAVLADTFGEPQSAEERAKEREAERRAAERDRENRLYEEARRHVDEMRWERAVERFNDVITMKGRQAEAALYFKAYSQDRLGQRAEALATLQALSRDYPSSRYLQQAKALEAEVRRNAGQPARPQDAGDEELKLMAMNAMMNTAPEQAVPMLEKLLAGTASPKLKEKALFVLAQSNSAQSREVLRNIAKGSSTPELQSRAISYLGMHGGRESRAILSEIYASSNDVDVKKRILRAFMHGGEKDRLFTAAQSEKDPELRATAVQQLGMMGAHAELSTLYQKETAVDVKKQIIRAMFVGGNSTRMIELAKGEQNPELRREAIRNLGLMGSKGTGEALVEIYGSDRDATVRKAVITALFHSDNAAALVAIARKEEDPTLKKEIVSRLSHMNSKVAIDYMLEIINK